MVSVGRGLLVSAGEGLLGRVALEVAPQSSHRAGLMSGVWNRSMVEMM